MITWIDQRSCCQALCAAVLHVAVACGGGDTAADVPVDVSDTAQGDAAQCHPKQRKADGSCCPAGQFYDFAGDTCAAVGPPECAENIFTSPEKCAPKWCWDWQDADKKTCKAWSANCETIGRICTAAEIADGGGCAAGTFPVSDKAGDCAAAGYFAGGRVPRDWNGDLAVLPPVPPLVDSIPVGVPPLAALPDVNNTFFCIDEMTKEPRFCTESEMTLCHRGPKGEMPDEKKCVYVGVPWPTVCPLGFIVDEKSPVGEGQLPPCLPDPADCGQAVWPDLAGATAVVYVSAADGNDAADGSKTAPFKTISHALALSASGATIAVAAGTYAESLDIAKPAAIFGRCAALVAIIGADKQSVVVVDTTEVAGDVSLTGVRISGKARGMSLYGGPKVKLSRVFIADTQEIGLYVDGTTAVLDADSVVIARTQAKEPKKTFGLGLDIEHGARATVKNMRLSANHWSGLYVADAGSHLQATGLLVDGTESGASDGLLGDGLVVNGGAQAVVAAGRLHGNSNKGLRVLGHASELRAMRLLVDATRPHKADQTTGAGASAQDGATLILQFARLTGNRAWGLAAESSATIVDATHLLIDGTLPRLMDGRSGFGAWANSAAELRLTDARFSANHQAGLLVEDDGTALLARQFLVDATLAQTLDKRYGQGVAVQKGAHAIIYQGRLTQNRTSGLNIGGSGTKFAAQFLLVDATLPRQLDQSAGFGLSVDAGAYVRLQDVRLSGNHTRGLMAYDATTKVEALHLLVDGTVGQASDGVFGLGVSVQGGAQMNLWDGRLSGNRDFGLVVDGQGSAMRASRLLIDGTLAQKSDQKRGWGVNVSYDAHLDLQATTVVGSRDAGVFVYAASLAAAGLAVRGTGPAADQTGGSGIWLLGKSTALLLASTFNANLGATVAVDHSTLTASGCTFSATGVGKYPEVNAKSETTGKVTSLADGVLLNASASLAFDRCLFFGNERAGFLAESCTGLSVTRCLINASNSPYGLVFQHTIAALDALNAVFGAAVQDRASDAGLSLPLPPEPVDVLGGEEGGP